MSEFRLAHRRVWVAGHRGMVGSALVRRLASEGCHIQTTGENRIDLRRQSTVEHWMAQARPEVVFVAAARVGGIFANDSRPAEFLYDNLLIEANIIEAAYQLKTAKLIMLGSSCIYPRLAEQPISEHALLTGPLEKTNEAYAVAKIAGLSLCKSYRRQYGCDYIAVMPTNLYGPGDNFDSLQSHVLPALMRKIHIARLRGEKTLHVWGSGAPKREFLHVDDLADACVFLLKNYSADEHINIGTGEDLTIRELAEMLCDVIGFKGELKFDTSKPDGAPRKLLNVDRLHALGWRHKIDLKEGINLTYRWFVENYATVRHDIPTENS